MNYVSSRLNPVQPSASAVVSAAAKAARARGDDVIDLGLGEPDFDTPAHIIEAAHQAALSGETRYPPMDGTPALKQAVVDKLARDNNLDYQPSEVIVSNGAKQIIFNAMMASLEQDDEVLLCAPYFGSYKDIVLILGGKPVSVPCRAEDRFRLTTQALGAAITPKTKWLFLNLPSNPSGAVFSADDLKAIGAVLEKHPDILVLSDEIYEHILFDGQEFLSFASACPFLKDRVLTVNGVSKAYAMTGWRIGFGAGPEPTAALTGPQDDVTRFCAAFEERRDLVVSRVAQIDGLKLDAPGGAFYALIGCDGFIGTTTPDGKTINDDVEFASFLLEEAKIAAVPGSAYGLSPFFRISTATSEAVLAKAMDRIEIAVQKLK